MCSDGITGIYGLFESDFLTHVNGTKTGEFHTEYGTAEAQRDDAMCYATAELGLGCVILIKVHRVGICGNYAEILNILRRSSQILPQSINHLYSYSRLLRRDEILLHV